MYGQYLMDEIIQHCVDIATNKSGCCALQQCLNLANDELRQHLLARIVANALLLSEDKYGFVSKYRNLSLFYVSDPILTLIL